MAPKLLRPPMLLLLVSFVFFAAPSSYGASSPLQALVAPITKDTPTSLYSISLNNHNPFVLDLTSPYLWSRCLPNHQPSVLPLTISTTNGRNPITPITVQRIVSSCASKSLLARLPGSSAGVAGLARSKLALSSQFFTKLKLRPQFAICLPSTSNAPGVAFFGNKPYYLLPPTSLEITTSLSYTSLLKNPFNPRDYYIDLKGMAVNGEAVQFLRRVLEFDSLGHGGVILSTTTPYTTLQSHVYRPFLQAFAKATKRIRRAPKVEPFDLCLNSTGLGSTRVGYAVPQIDLMLPGGKNWTIFGANSLKQVGPETACLAFVDGGPKAQYAVEIGGFQMENNFLLFDYAKSRLGFSSSLFFIRTTCGNFNFTTGF